MLGQLLSVDISSFPTYSLRYSIPYLFLGLIVLIIGWDWIFRKKKSPFPKKRLLLIMSMFVLFFGFRWHLFSDTARYSEIYADVDTNLSLQQNVANQPFVDFGYMFIIFAAKSIGMGFHFFIFLNSLVDFSLMYFCIRRYSINPPLTCLFFLAFQGILIEANLLRNTKAILVFLLSLKYIEEKRLVKYLLCQMIAITLHMSSLIFIPVYWILNRKWNFKIVLYISLFAVFVYLFASDFIAQVTNNLLFGLIGGEGKMSLLAKYSENNQETLLSIGTLERLLFLALTLLVYRFKLKENHGIPVMFANMYVIYFFLFALLGFNFVFRDRIPLLFIGAYWFFAPIIIERLRKRIPGLKLLLILLAFMKISATTRICSAYYETVLFHNTTRDERKSLDAKVANQLP